MNRQFIHTQDEEIVKEYLNKGYKIHKVIHLNSPRFGRKNPNRKIYILVLDIV